MTRALTFAAVLLASATAFAQPATFPADDAFIPIECDGMISYDVETDAGANERNIVGDATDPAASYAVDAEYLYLRMRLTDDPTQGAGFTSFGWSWGLDVDDDELFEAFVVIVGTGMSDRVEVIDQDPDDGTTDTVTLSPAGGTMNTYAIATDAGTTIGGTMDWYVTAAVPLTTLETFGVSGTFFCYPGTSTNFTGIDADWACFDGDPARASDVPVDAIAVSCGDGMLDSGESCDDGNADGGDGCSSSCIVEGGFVCTGEPSTCERDLDTDTDGDGIANDADGDADGDGIRNGQEVASLADPSGDADGDDVPNYADPDSVDCTPDGETPARCAMLPLDIDRDQDGLPDHLDTDSDDDGVPDSVEGHDVDADGMADRVASGSDTDGDGIDDSYDTDDGGTEAPVQDTDDDGVPDFLDTDDDDDGALTENECPDFASGCPDGDSDGTPDYLDADGGSMDSDGDGLADIVECPIPGSCPDTDGDGLPDFEDPDDDNDGIPTATEVADTAALPSPSTDVDGDGLPNWRDADSDGDGIADGDEATDANADGVPDYLQPPTTTPTGGAAGGSFCSAAADGPTAAWPLLLAGLWLVRRHRRG